MEILSFEKTISVTEKTLAKVTDYLNCITLPVFLSSFSDFLDYSISLYEDDSISYLCTYIADNKLDDYYVFEKKQKRYYLKKTSLTWTYNESKNFGQIIMCGLPTSNDGTSPMKDLIYFGDGYSIHKKLTENNIPKHEFGIKSRTYNQDPYGEFPYDCVEQYDEFYYIKNSTVLYQNNKQSWFSFVADYVIPIYIFDKVMKEITYMPSIGIHYNDAKDDFMTNIRHFV